MSPDSPADFAPLTSLTVRFGDAPSPDAPDDAPEPPPLLDVYAAVMPRHAAAGLLRQFADVLDPPTPPPARPGMVLHNGTAGARSGGTPDVSAYAGTPPRSA